MMTQQAFVLLLPELGPMRLPLLVRAPRPSLPISLPCCATSVSVLATKVILGRADGCLAQQEATRVLIAEGQPSGMGRL